ncbi:MAG TPA: dihydroxy-acid dehydratase [Gaiellales bacterium]|jgi:dihydroxy-acid dehydratase|nr:dihydroxy-acid dehydratase [Gaiellales bacterium]
MHGSDREQVPPSDRPRDASRLRSARWLDAPGVSGFIHRSSLRSEGLSSSAISGRPVIGICNPWSELVNCNLHFRGLAAAVRRGVQQAGGLPLEFGTSSLGENLMKPTTMLYRNLMAMDVEENIRSHPLDAVVLLAGCDKTVPAELMGATSVDVPVIMVTGGPAQPARFRGQEIAVGSDLWRFAEDVRAGRMSEAEFAEFEAAANPSVGHCNELGTASTMAAIVEALGMTLPGAAAVPAVDARRYAIAELAGARAVELAWSGLRPSHVLTAEAFDNAIVVLAALGGSTNAIIHLIALAGRAGVDLPLERFDEIAARTPLLVNLRPAGEHLFEDLFHAGGIQTLMAELLPLLHADAIGVNGRTLAENVQGAAAPDGVVVGTLAQPFGPAGSLAVLRGSLAPSGAVLKVSAATAGLLQHSGPAVVFDDIYDLARRIDDDALAIGERSVLVLRNAGPKGGPGMPEWGMLPIPQRLLERGVRDMLRISDARMSGTGFGTVVLHVSPEAADGGPLGAVDDGDIITLDVARRTLNLEVEERELAARLARRPPRPPAYRRGYGALFAERIQQADRGCDFDFLERLPDELPETDPLGFLPGSIGGW